MKQLFLLHIVKTFCFFSLTAFLLGCGTNASAGSAQPTQTTNNASISSPTPTSTPTPTVAPTPTPNFSTFVGSWYKSGGSLTILANGNATFAERTYNWCNSGAKPPCDSTNGNNIVNGYQEQIVFAQTVGSVAYGTVTSSTFHPSGLAVTVTLQSNNTLIYSGDPTASVSPLCGPSSPPNACGQF